MPKHLVTPIAAASLLIAIGYAVLASPIQGHAPSAAPADCPLPSEEGETWISRRWIDGGELRLECTHVAGFPAFDLPTAHRVGLVQ